MKYFSYIMLALFWLGIFLCVSSKKSAESVRLRPAGLKNGLKSTRVFKGFSGFSVARKKDSMLQELAESLAYIRNITLLGRGRSISAEMLLEELSEFCPGLRKTYLNMAHCLSLNEKDKASDLLYKAIGNNYAKDIGSFLVRWEDIKQEELISSLESYRDIIRQERITKLKRKDEMISDLVYLPVVLNCMVVLLNFIYVSYFIEQREALNMLMW